MKGLYLLLIALALFITGTVSGQVYRQSTIDVPEDFAAPEGALPALSNQFFMTRDWDGQVRLTVMISRITNGTGKYDVLNHIGTFDVRGGVGTSNTSIHARVIALSNVGLSGNPKFAESLLFLLRQDKVLPTRIEATRALVNIVKATGNKDLELTVVSRIIELLNDPQRYDFVDFNRADRQNKYFDEDRAAEAMVIALGDIGNPKAFSVLLKIVNKKNHRDETIDAAWLAMKRLKWY